MEGISGGSCKDAERIVIVNMHSVEEPAWGEHPSNPQNWSSSKKIINMGIVSLLAFITYGAFLYRSLVSYEKKTYHGG